MSDSDEDLLPNNVFTFQNDNTTISASGPNNTNINGLSFRNNVFSSTMHKPTPFERSRYGGSNLYQRSMYSRRETSPMSLKSVPNSRVPTFSHSGYQNGMSSQRSMHNGRGGSPMSVRSIDTTASVSVADIVFAFKHVKFNKYDLRTLKDAYTRFIRTRQRKKVEKRRNLKLFLKGTRRRSGYDSGEQASDSSISSDDCRSVRTTICKENIPGLKQMRDLSHFSSNIERDIRQMRDVSHFDNDIREVPMFTDRTDSIKQISLRNIIPVSTTSNFNVKERIPKSTAYHDQNQSIVKAQNTSLMTQKERFKKGFLLPSERFNKTVSKPVPVNNNNRKNVKNLGKNNVESSKKNSSSDEDEIFHGFSVSQNDTDNVRRKRSLDNEHLDFSNKKRNNSDSPEKLQRTEPPDLSKNNQNGKSNDFIFAKPVMPIKKGNTKKDPIPKKQPAKSRVPPIAEEIDFDIEKSNKKLNKNENNNDVEADTTHSTNDVSMRPSFIKRKLFTQKLDVAEQKNASSDSLSVNSPQNMYKASTMEKSKARKLITSQSCLSREVTGEDNNVLDLIHKIVTPDEINNTNVANKTGLVNNTNNETENTGKWDVSAVIANCESQDVSDTYTDEEIFNTTQIKKVEESKKSVQNSKKSMQCGILVKKLSPQTINKFMKNDVPSSRVQNKLANKVTRKKSVTDCVKSFWDTDFESDMEFNVPPPLRNNIQQKEENVLPKNNKVVEDKPNGSIKKVPISKTGILTVRSCQKSLSNYTLKSNKSTSSNITKCVEVDKPNSVQEKDNTEVKNNKETKISRASNKKDGKENIPVNAKKEEAGRKPNTKQNIVKNKKQNQVKTPKNANKKLTKHNNDSDNKKEVAKVSPKNDRLRTKSTLKSKDSRNMEAKQIDKVIKSSQKNNTKTIKEYFNDGRLQPRRKCKDQSLNQSSMDKSTIMTRSRSRELSFNSSQGDYSNTDLSNVSKRILRLHKRVQKNKLL